MENAERWQDGDAAVRREVCVCVCVCVEGGRGGREGGLGGRGSDRVTCRPGSGSVTATGGAINTADTDTAMQRR